MLNNDFYRVAYEYHKKWSPYPATVEDWREASKEASRICADGGKDKFLVDLMVAVCGELIREYRKQERGEDVA